MKKAFSRESKETTNTAMSNSTTASQTFSDGFRAGTAAFSIFLILGTVFGNTLVIAAFSRYERIRSVTNYFLVSLACTDLCVALFSMPVWVAYLLTGPNCTRHWLVTCLDHGGYSDWDGVDYESHGDKF